MRPWENEHPTCLLSDSEYLSLSSLITQETTLCSSFLLCLVGLGLHHYLKLQLQNFSAGQGAYLEYAKLALTLSRICQTSPKMLHICAPSWYVEIKSLLQLDCGHGFTLDECSLLSVKPEKHSFLRACATQSSTSAERRKARKTKIKKRRKKKKRIPEFLKGSSRLHMPHNKVPEASHSLTFGCCLFLSILLGEERKVKRESLLTMAKHVLPPFPHPSPEYVTAYVLRNKPIETRRESGDTTSPRFICKAYSNQNL